MKLNLPDDIEQRLIDGHRSFATYELMARMGISLEEAKKIVGTWLSDPGKSDYDHPC